MPNPVHKRQCESLFFTIENLPRHSQSLGEFSEHIFLFAAAQLPLRGEAHRPFNKLVIENWGAHFERGQHAHTIHLC